MQPPDRQGRLQYDQNANMHPKYAKQWPEGQIANPRMQTDAKNALRAFVLVRLPLFRGRSGSATANKLKTMFLGGLRSTSIADHVHSGP